MKHFQMDTFQIVYTRLYTLKLISYGYLNSAHSLHSLLHRHAQTHLLATSSQKGTPQPKSNQSPHCAGAVPTRSLSCQQLRRKSNYAPDHPIGTRFSSVQSLQRAPFGLFLLSVHPPALSYLVAPLVPFVGWLHPLQTRQRAPPLPLHQVTSMRSSNRSQYVLERRIKFLTHLCLFFSPLY